MTSSFNLNYQLPNFKILKFLIRSIISGLITINTDSHSSVTRDIPAESTSLPRWLPHPLTSPLFPDLTLLISFHHTDYNICHLSLSLPLSRCLSVTGTVVTYHRDAFTQNLLSTKPSISPLLLHVFQLHSDLHLFPTHRRLLRLSPKTNIFYFQLLAFVAILSTCATHSSYILHFFCPILLLSFFFPTKKINIKLPSISIFNAHFAISSNCFAFFLDLSLCLHFFTLHCLSIIDLPPVTPSFLPRLLASSLLSLPPSLL